MESDAKSGGRSFLPAETASDFAHSRAGSRAMNGRDSPRAAVHGDPAGEPRRRSCHLYALLRLLTMAPEGPVAIIPSDHFVSDDRVFMAHVEGALDMVVSRPELAIVLGIAPDTDESGVLSGTAS